MAKTVVGLYEDFKTAEQVVRDLEKNGFAREDISLAARDQTGGDVAGADTTQGSKAGEHAAAGAGTGAVLGGLAGLVVGLGALAIPGIGPIIAAGPLATTLAGAGIGAAAGGLIGALTGAGVPEEDARAYAQGVRGGGTLVMVNSPDDRADQASDIMNRYHPIDIDTRYRQETMGGETTEEMREVDMGGGTTTDQTHQWESRQMDREDETHIPIVEEEMRVGKRQVNRGGVRIHSYVTEKPVEETQQLRDETVNVERRPADRPVSEGDLNAAFQEQTFEVTETDEELVTDKSAHVVEDVEISKNVEQHPETARGTVRKTEVETERFDANPSRSGSRNFDAYASDFRNHYQTQYATSGRNFNDYQPAYRYGYDLANNPKYRGRDWSQIETDARRDWERSHQGTRWEDFRDSVRYAWERGIGGTQNTGSSGMDNFS